MDFSDYVPVAEAAKICGISRTTMWTWVKAGKIPSIRVGRNFRVKRSDALKMIVQS